MAARLLLCVLAFAVTDVPAVTVERLREQARAYAASDRFFGAVAVARDGQILYAEAFGNADEEWGIPNTTDTKFRIGSVTKQFTGFAVLLLEQQGKLHVGDSICKYLDPCPERWRAVTLHHLLTHTSGIPNFTAQPQYKEWQRRPLAPAATAALVADLPLDFKPGARMQYSNTGYVLLGVAIEKASGMDYGAFLKESVFEPLSMKDTGVDDIRAVLAKRARGYECLGECANAGFIDMKIPHAAGALYSTVLDLVKWDAGIREGKLLSKENYQRWITPARNDYAYGWFVRPRDGFTEVSHGGGIDGFLSHVVRYPELGIVAVGFSNHVPSAVTRLTNDLADLAAGREVKLPEYPKEIEVSSKVLQDYVGVYQLSPAFAITITLENGRLMSQATNQPKFPVFASSENEFFLKAVDARLRFERDDNGKVTSLVLVQGGREARGTRQP